MILYATKKTTRQSFALRVGRGDTVQDIIAALSRLDPNAVYDGTAYCNESEDELQFYTQTIDWSGCSDIKPEAP